MTRTRIVRIVAALSLAAGLACHAHAQKAGADDDANQPVNIEADRGSFDDLKQVAVFVGNVILTRGSLVMRADRLEVRQTPEGFQYGTAYGNGDRLASFRQRRVGTEQYVEGYGERIELDGRSDIVTLHQRAQMRRIENGNTADELSGHTITYNHRTDVYNVTSGTSASTPGNPQGRVRATIGPRSTTDSTTTPPAPALPLRPTTGLPSSK